MGRKLAVFYAFVLLFENAGAQDSLSLKRKVGFYAHVGVSYGNFSELNSVLSQTGYPELRFYGEPTYGITLSNKKNNSYSFVAVSILSSNPSSVLLAGTSKYARLRGWEIQIGRTFDLINNPKWAIYPFIGEGIGYGELVLYDNIVQQPFAASISNLNSPNRKTWNSFYIQVNGGVGAERRLRIGAYDFFLGGTVGYRLAYSRFTEDFPGTSRAPVHLSGVEWQIKMRFELWRKPKSFVKA